MSIEKRRKYEDIEDAYSKHKDIRVGLGKYLSDREKEAGDAKEIGEALLDERIVGFVSTARKTNMNVYSAIALAVLKVQNPESFENAVSLANGVKNYPEEAADMLVVLSRVSDMIVSLKDKSGSAAFDGLVARVIDRLSSHGKKLELERMMEVVDVVKPYIILPERSLSISAFDLGLRGISAVVGYEPRGASQEDEQPAPLRENVLRKEDTDKELSELEKKVLAQLLVHDDTASELARKMKESQNEVYKACQDLNSKSLVTKNSFEVYSLVNRGKLFNRWSSEHKDWQASGEIGP